MVQFFKVVYIKFTIKAYKNDRPWTERYLFYVHVSFKVVLEFLPKVTTLVLPSKLALTYK